MLMRAAWGWRHALMVVLGYSHLLWLRFYLRKTVESSMNLWHATLRQYPFAFQNFANFFKSVPDISGRKSYLS